jgi:hypothetical protein
MNKLDGLHEDVGGSGSQMPLSGPFLTEDTRGQIRSWIAAGALEN